MLLMDLISPTVQLKGTDPSCGAAVQPSLVKQSHILPGGMDQLMLAEKKSEHMESSTVPS